MKLNGSKILKESLIVIVSIFEFFFSFLFDQFFDKVVDILLSKYQINNPNCDILSLISGLLKSLSDV